jgi:hypothetical protein
MPERKAHISFGQLQAAERVRQSQRKERGRVKQKTYCSTTNTKDAIGNLRPPWNDRFSVDSSDICATSEFKSCVARKKQNGKDSCGHHHSCSNIRKGAHNSSSSRSRQNRNIFQQEVSSPHPPNVLIAHEDHITEESTLNIYSITDRSDGSPVLTTYCRLPCPPKKYRTPTTNVVTRSCSPMNFDEIQKALGQQQSCWTNHKVDDDGPLAEANSAAAAAGGLQYYHTTWWSNARMPNTVVTQKQPSVHIRSPIKDSSLFDATFISSQIFTEKDAMNLENFRFALNSYRVQSFPLLYSNQLLTSSDSYEKHYAATTTHKESNAVDR